MWTNVRIVEEILQNKIQQLYERSELQKSIAKKLYDQYKDNWKNVYKIGCEVNNKIYSEVEKLNELAIKDWKDASKLNFILVDLCNHKYKPINPHLELFELLLTDRDETIQQLTKEELNLFEAKKGYLINRISNGYIDLSEAIIELQCSTLGVKLKEKKIESKKINKI